MNTYLERLCIFICLGDLLGNFLPSPKFEKLYRYIVGILVLLLIVQPLGENVAKALENTESDMGKSFGERIAGQNTLWDAGSGTETIREETEKIMERYLERMTEKEVKAELEEHGYEIPDTDESDLNEPDGEGR